MTLLAEYIVFGILMSLTICVGVYVSLRGKASRSQTTAEVFLGNRSLRFLPLAASVAASLISSTSFVTLTGHFYAYGFHFMYSRILTIPAASIASHVFLPAMYEMRLTSVFQYIRMRFHSSISLTACLIYVIVTLSMGALSIFAGSLALVTVFDLPLVWCNIAVGLSATVYTGLGGFRGVVWTDCIQLIFIVLGPATIITKVFVDWQSAGTYVQPIRGFDARSYFWNAQLDISNDESVWALLASLPSAFYRVSMDQIVVQRFLASRTLANARRTVLMGSVFLCVAYAIELSMALSLVFWFRGCDPQLTGAIENYDQILPYYIKTHLLSFPGFTGLFLAAVISAGTSTLSSAINSLTALLHVDVLPHFFESSTYDTPMRTQALAFCLGIVVTLYSCICAYMGSVTRAMLLVYSAAAGPCVGLLVLAVGFPFVHSKGAGISTLLLFAVQLYLLWQRIGRKILPTLMPVTVQYCSENATYLQKAPNDTITWEKDRSPHNEAPSLISAYWSSLFSVVGTVLLGILISVVTGEQKEPPADIAYLNRPLAKMWQKLRVVKYNHLESVQPGMDENTTNGALVSQEEEVKCLSTSV